MAAVAGNSGRIEEPSPFVALVDGLMERVQRSPLMRRAAAQLSPEEQLTLVQVLADLASLRQLRSAIEQMPPLRVELLALHWPELAELLTPPRRAGSTAGRIKARDGGSETGLPTLFDAPSPSQPLPNEGPASEAAPEALAAGTLESVSPAPDLAKLLTDALAETGRALNTTQMLTWLETHGVQVAREQVTDTLFRHEDRFRRRGASQWVAAGLDPHN